MLTVTIKVTITDILLFLDQNGECERRTKNEEISICTQSIQNSYLKFLKLSKFQFY